MLHNPPAHRPPLPRLHRAVAGSALLLSALLLAVGAARSQGVCSSDGQPTPGQLVERFIPSDCTGCWERGGSLAAGPGNLVLDWIVPTALGEEAPLAAAATRDALTRLTNLRRPAPAGRTDQHRTRVTPSAADPSGNGLRVAHGVALGGYLGTAIEYRPATAPRRVGTGPVSLWLVLLEDLPVGTEGTPIPRFLVRNLLQLAWTGPATGSSDGPPRFSERRPMQIPEGAQPDRLRVAGWVQDAQGRILAAAQSACTDPNEPAATTR